jgi:hypothetical protein
MAEFAASIISFRWMFSETSALARIYPGLLAKNDPASCFRRRGVSILRGHRRTGLARVGARQAVRDGVFWTFPATFPSDEAFYTPSARMTRSETQHAEGVDDTLLLLALAILLPWCGSL